MACAVVFFSTAHAGETLARVQSEAFPLRGQRRDCRFLHQGRQRPLDRDGRGLLPGGGRRRPGRWREGVFRPSVCLRPLPRPESEPDRSSLRNTTQTLGREANIGTHFAGILYYDGQSFLIPADSRVQQVRDLDGASICVLKESTHVAHMADYFKAHGLDYQPIIVESVTQAKDEFFAGRCQAYTSDASTLASVRVEAPGGPDAFRILPERISKEPLGPVVNRGDEQWFTLVKWVLLTLIEAEERGTTRANVRQVLETTADPAVQAFLDKGGGYAKAMGISPGWGMRVVETVGNYGEIFERNLGSQSAFKIERGLNRLWNQGGLMYSPPFR